ncbi:hypothetical protein ACE6H2_020668 [Prunus campanulata]
MSVENSFGKLPDHLLIEIFIRVLVSEWAQISCVKKQWANMFRGECLWQAALATTYPLANQVAMIMDQFGAGVTTYVSFTIGLYMCFH